MGIFACRAVSQASVALAAAVVLGLPGVGTAAEGAAQGQPLVTDLRGGRDGDLADPVVRQVRVAPQQFPDHPDHQVVGAVGAQHQGTGAGVDGGCAARRRGRCRL